MISSKEYLSGYKGGCYLKTIGTAAIETTYDYLKADGAVKSIENPRNHADGYIEYLDGDKRKKYWESYFKILWDKYEGIRKEYDNDYEKFQESWQMQLALTRKPWSPQR